MSIKNKIINQSVKEANSSQGNINDFAKGWHTRLLGDIAETTSGGTPSRSVMNYWNGNIPWLKSGELNDDFIDNAEEFITEDGLVNSSAKIFKKGTLLLALYGATAGKLGILNFDSATNQAICAITSTFNKVDVRYIFYFLLKERKRIIADSFGGAQPNISQGYIRNLIVPLPPSLNYQKLIVKKLDYLFLKIDKIIALVMQNLEHSKHVYLSVLNQVFENENTSWKTYELFEKFKLINGRAYKREELLSDGKYQVIRIQNLNGGDNWYFSELELERDKYCENGDLLFSWSGTPHSSFGAFIWKGDKAIFHYHIWKIELLDKGIDLGFAYHLFNYITEVAINESHGGTGMMHITKAKMEKIMIKVPDLKMQRKLSLFLSNIRNKEENLYKEYTNQLRHFRLLKSSLLDKAFKGELIK